MDQLYKQLIDVNLYIRENGIALSSDQQLNEGVTFYDLRQFLSVLKRTTTDDKLKDMLKSLIKTVAKLEVRNVPVPTIAKLKSVSPEIFPK